jgi:hypothetical protein
MRLLLVFVDGIGVGRPGAHNPFDGAPVRILAPLAGRPDDGDPRVAFVPVDATLGHPGLPQSATGQAAIFTGEDAVAVAGGHREGYPTRAVGELLQRASILARVRRSGRRAALLNAFDPSRAARLTRIARGEEPRSREARLSATALAGLAGGGELRTLADAHAGRAVTFDFTGEVCRAFGLQAPARSIGDAARTLAAAAAEVDVGLFETFLTDKAGHAQDISWARHEILRVERFLAALMAAIDPAEQLVVVTSDHGNLEDLSTRSHTRAPVPLMAFGGGPGTKNEDAEAFVRGAQSLLDIAPRILARMA